MIYKSFEITYVGGKNENIYKNYIENIVTYIFIYHNDEFYYRKCGSKNDFQ